MCGACMFRMRVAPAGCVVHPVVHRMVSWCATDAGAVRSKSILVKLQPRSRMPAFAHVGDRQ